MVRQKNLTKGYNPYQTEFKSFIEVVEFLLNF